MQVVVNLEVSAKEFYDLMILSLLEELEKSIIENIVKRN